jgi:hypothetical protein
MTEDTSVWDHLDELAEGERKALVDSAVSVLNRKLQPAEAIAVDMPASQLKGQMATALAEEGLPATQESVSALMSSAADPSSIVAVLSALSSVPGLREEIDQAYRRRQEMMVLDLGMVTGPVLIVLLLKLKRIKIDSSGVDVQFFDAHKSAVEMIRRMIGM